MAEKGGYKHFMLKEIFEQPRAVRDTTLGRVGQESGRIFLDEMDISAKEFKEFRQIRIVACGTSWHAALAGKFMIERLARIPVEVDYGSEFRYRDPIVGPDTLTIVISQSGETADTLAAQREARAKALEDAGDLQRGRLHDHARGVGDADHARGSGNRRRIDEGVHVPADGAVPDGHVPGTGPRKTGPGAIHEAGGPASEAAGAARRSVAARRDIRRTDEGSVSRAGFSVSGTRHSFPDCARRCAQAEGNFLHSRRRISGRRDEARSERADRREAADGGDRHPRPHDDQSNMLYEKTLSNIQEVKARGGLVVAVACEGDAEVGKVADHVIPVGTTSDLLLPILEVIPLQMLAYHIAVRRGCDVDQPRNLAKSVTVE